MFLSLLNIDASTTVDNPMRILRLFLNLTLYNQYTDKKVIAYIIVYPSLDSNGFGSLVQQTQKHPFGN